MWYVVKAEQHGLVKHGLGLDCTHLYNMDWTNL